MAIFDTWLPFLIASCHRWNFGDTTLTNSGFEERLVLISKKFGKLLKKNLIKKLHFHLMPVKIVASSSKAVKIDPDFIDYLCQTFTTLPQGMFETWDLKGLNIERWNLETRFSESPQFVQLFLARYGHIVGETPESWGQRFLQDWHTTGLVMKQLSAKETFRWECVTTEMNITTRMNISLHGHKAMELDYVGRVTHPAAVKN